MRELVVSEFVSLDGVMEAPRWGPGFAHSGWVTEHPEDPEQLRFKLDEIRAADVLLLGRVTYESFAAAWPERSDAQGFAEKMNSMRKYVISTTLTEPQWNNTRVLDSSVADSVTELKQQDGGDILLVGSRSLVHTLYRHDLIDEYRFMVFPVVLGSGRRLFPHDTLKKMPLELAASKTFPTGVAVHTYRRNRTQPDPAAGL